MIIKERKMDAWNFISRTVSWVLGTAVSLIGLLKTFDATKKFFDEKVTPDINSEETIEEIKRRQELARNIVAFAGIEAAYNVARGLVLALNFGLLLHYAFKFSERVTSSDKK
jgi:hypothetical protein